MNNCYQLDARRLLCPLPVIRTQNKIKQLVSGDRLEVICTDPGVLADIPAWCRMNGHQVLHCVTENKEIKFVIQVA